MWFSGERRLDGGLVGSVMLPVTSLPGTRWPGPAPQQAAHPCAVPEEPGALGATLRQASRSFAPDRPRWGADFPGVRGAVTVGVPCGGGQPRGRATLRRGLPLSGGATPSWPSGQPLDQMSRLNRPVLNQSGWHLRPRLQQVSQLAPALPVDRPCRAVKGAGKKGRWFSGRTKHRSG